MDTDYHRIVDDALSKERKILEDASNEADQIINQTNYVSQESKESLDQALSRMASDLQTGALHTSQSFLEYYYNSLKHISAQSLNEYQTTIKKFEQDLHKQAEDFRQAVLPNMEKELAEYKQARLKEAEKMIRQIVAQASQEVMNKSITLEDHQKLVLEALEKAAKEGIFD